MKEWQLLVSVLFILLIRWTECDGRNTYVSSEKISLLFDYDDKMTQLVRTVIDKKYSDTFSHVVEEKNQDLDFTISLLNGSRQSDVVSFHPINQFLILYKFNQIWPRMSRTISLLFGEGVNRTRNSSDAFLNLVDHLQRSIDQTTIPDDDLSKAATSLLRLQELYKLNTSRLAKFGSVRNILALRGLRNDEIEYLAGEAAGFRDVCRTYSWTKEATLQKTKHSSLNMSSQANLPRLLKEHCKQISCLTGERCEAHTKVSLKYAKLCASGHKYTKQFQKLGCDNWVPHPVFYLQPVKREWLNIRPNLFVIYNLMNSTEADLFWKSAPFAKRSAVMNEAGTTRTEETRTGITAWLWDVTPVVERVTTRIGNILTKEMKFSEKYQIANYGIGGHYYMHHDHFTEEALRTQYFARSMGWSNRLITVVIYLSDVLEGGYTVFPKLNISVAPRKGTAVIWENLRSDGNPYDETLHAGCPVLIGSKKIANKWINYEGQFINAPCKDEDRFVPL